MQLQHPCQWLRTVLALTAADGQKPLPRSWTEPAGAYLLLGHGFFMLRPETSLSWKTEEAANKFELLVTSGHDRVFGEMVKAKQAEERKKKDKEYRERKAAEKKKAEEEKKKAEEEKKKSRDAQADATASPKQGAEEAEPEAKDVDPALKRKGEGEAEVKANDVEAVVVQGEKAVIAVGVPGSETKKQQAENKHEAEPIAGAPGEATKPGLADAVKAEAEAEVKAVDPKGVKEEGNGRVENAKSDKGDGDKGKGDKGKDDKADGGHKKNKVDAEKHKPRDGKPPFDPLREAELLAKMVAAGETPEGLDMEDVRLAFKALEAAAHASKDHRDKREQQPYIWTWHESCERWRWRNYEAGLHLVGPGGWEERDWKVFADGRGCDEFDLEESWAEEDERDIYDWSV
jgi:hypothetical protein